MAAPPPSPPTMRAMELIRLDGPLDETLREPVVLLALDGWTDAGRAGTLAAEALREQWDEQPVGHADPDALYDYRDRRPLLTIDDGFLGQPEWPQLEVVQLTSHEGLQALLVTGAEPDLSWQQLCRDLVELADLTGARRYVGLGAVPGPVPHTRPTRIVSTGSREDLIDRVGLPHERLVVPASCQVVIESAMRDADRLTLGMWARIPHYVAGEYPDGARTLLARLGDHLGVSVDPTDLIEEAATHRRSLDEAAASSPEITEHISELEQLYDAESGGGSLAETFSGELPTGDEIAAELQRFLQERGDEG